MHDIEVHHMTARLEAQLFARRAEQAARRAELAPAPQRPIRERLVAGLASLGHLIDMPLSAMRQG